MKKEYIITAVVLMTAGLALFVGALFASDFDFSKLDISKYETNTYTVSADFDKIEINTEETDIVWIPSEDDGVKVVCIEKEKIRHSVSVENGTLKISEETQTINVSNLSSGNYIIVLYRKGKSVARTMFVKA